MPDFLKYEGQTCAVPAFRSLFYFDGSLSDKLIAEGARSLMDVFLEGFGSGAQYVAIGDQKTKPKPKVVTPESIAWACRWLATPGMEFGSSLRFNAWLDHPDEIATVPHFRVDEHRDLVIIEVSVRDDANDLVAFADRLTDVVVSLPLRTAVMGMGFYMPSTHDSLAWTLPRTTTRYRAAIEFLLPAPIGGIRKERSFFPYAKHPGVEPGIADVGWRTFVGTPFLDRLPNLVEVAETPGVKIEQRGGIAILTAGEMPIWGDANEGEDVAAYKAVARVLKPVRFPIEVAYGSLFGNQFSDPEGRERIKAYINRFD
jgi:hypothetical protein